MKHLLALIRNLKNKLSYADLILILIVIIFAFSFFFFFYRKANYIEIKVRVLQFNSSPITDWTSNKFIIGDVEKDMLGRINAEITNINKYDIGYNNQTLLLNMKVKATYDNRSKLYSIKGRTLVYGRTLQFNFSKLTFEGLIVEFPGSDKDSDTKSGKAIVSGFKRGIDPKLVNLVKKGDKIADSNGILLAEILDILVKPAERVIPDNSGNLHLRYDPLYKDVTYTVALKTKILNGRAYVFDNIPLVIPQDLPLQFGNYFVDPVITDIKFVE